MMSGSENFSGGQAVQPEPVPPLIYDQLTAIWPELYEAHLAALREQAVQERIDAIDPMDPLIVQPGVAQ